MLGGKFNLGSLMKNAKKIQEMMEDAQAELAKIEVTGEAGAGMVKVVLSAQNEVKKLDISPEALQEPKEVIEDLIAAAFNDASKKVTQVTQEKMLAAGSLFSDEDETKDDE